MKNRAFFSTLMLLSLPLWFNSGICFAQQGASYVTIYEDPDFKGREKHYDIGSHRLHDFNDAASSIKVPAGWVVIVYEDSAEGGGFGRWVDFLEDQPNLANYNLNKKISHLLIFKRKNPEGKYWVRNHTIGGQFMEGYWKKGPRLPPSNTNPVVAPPKPPPPPVFCTISGRVIGNVDSYGTVIRLARPDNSTQFSVNVVGEQYTIPNVPSGSYEVMGRMTKYTAPAGSYGLKVISQGSQAVTCENGKPITQNFEIKSGGG